MSKTFFENFKENMDAMGAPCPQSLYGTAAVATATAKTLIDLVAKFGTRVTLLEIIQAGGLAKEAGAFASATGAAELATVGAGLIASAYAGIVIGSLIVAVDKTFMGDVGGQLTTNLADLYYQASQVLGGSMPKWLEDLLFAQQAGGLGSPSKLARNKTGSRVRNAIG